MRVDKKTVFDNLKSDRTNANEIQIDYLSPEDKSFYV